MILRHLELSLSYRTFPTQPLIKMQKFLSKDLFGKDFNTLLTDLFGQLVMIVASKMNDVFWIYGEI